MKRVFGLLVVVCWCGAAMAQQVPDINDVYAADQAPGAAGLGPAGDPSEILDDFAARMLGCDRLDYAVRVTVAAAGDESPSGFEGVVTIGRGPGGDFDRFRIDLTGSTPAGDAVDVTLGSSGRGYYVIDQARRTVTEFETRDDSTPFGSIARFALISDLTTGDAPVAVSRSEAAVGGDVVHFVDGVRGEHLYGVFSEQDSLPRLIERVVLGPDSRATVVRTLIANLEVDAAGPESSFTLDAPDGFLRTKGPSEKASE